MDQSDPAHGASLPFERVLDEEYLFLHGPPAEPDRAGGTDGGGAIPLAAHESAAHTALCLSGGGIRSASFNLGLLQGLAHAGLLDRFDYLSTVSGGGYVGGWLTAWRTRARAGCAPDPMASLAGSTVAATDPPVDPLGQLRRNVRFLDPHVGIQSVDVWTLATIILRNLLLNWVVLVPLLAAAALLPRLYLGVLDLPTQKELVSKDTLAAWYGRDWIVCLGLFAIAALFAARELPSLGNRRHGQKAFLLWFLTPVVLGELVLSIHRFWAWRFEGGFTLRGAVLVGIAGMLLPWLGGGLLSARWWRPWTWLAAAAAGGLGRAAIWSTSHEFTEMARHHPQIFASADIPLTLGLLFLQMTLFAGLASRDMTDDDREWWGRAAAWVLMVAVGWLFAGTLVIYAPILLLKTYTALGVSETTGHAWLATLTLVTSGAASRLGSSWTRVSTTSQSVERWLFVLAAPVLVLLLMLLLATVDLRLLQYVHNLDLFRELTTHPIGGSLPEDLLVLGALLAVGAAVSRLVSVNAFSLHGMYRKRLARTFLGTSRAPADRKANPFTGFDDDDDLRLHDTAAAGRPLHVINATLNLVSETSLAMQERRSQSFTMSALHCGSCGVGYRPSDAYAGAVSLSQCMTVSGAAVSPNMGAASKPALTFLLTLFNARLGAWVANPGPAGDAIWRQSRLSYGATPLLDELLGRTTDTSPHVYLSDGGHFENLGVYEMIRRRCRLIVVSDAGCDPDYQFDDLANAIRKARLDFGVDVVFPDGLGITGEGRIRRSRFAVGRIHYSAADPMAPDGVLLYVKAVLCGDEPVDVANYAAANPLFPHQPTSNQWFDEAQFESYRMLGAHTMAVITGGHRFASVEELCETAAARRAVGVPEATV
jgi:hypothetical protein